MKVIKVELRNPKRIRGFIGYAKIIYKESVMRAFIWLLLLLLLSIFGLRVKGMVA